MPTGDMWGPGPERRTPLSRSARRQQRRGTTSKHRTLKWIGGVLLVLIVLSAIGAHHKSPSSANQSASKSTHPTFVVATHSSVTVTQAGFVKEPTNGFGDRMIDYGLVLKNRSASLAVIGVQVTVSFINPGGAKFSQYPSSTTLTGIPANGGFYLGGSVLASTDMRSTTMKISISIDRSSSGRLVLPTVKNLNISGAVLPTLTGIFNNPYNGQPGQSWAGNSEGTLYIVYFDSRGKIIGSDTEDMLQYENPQPGMTSSFTISTAPPSSAVKAEASIDPCSEVLGSLSTDCVAFQ